MRFPLLSEEGNQVLGRRMYFESNSAAALELSVCPSFFFSSPGLAPKAGISMTVVASELSDSTVGAALAGPSSIPKSNAAAESESISVVDSASDSSKVVVARLASIARVSGSMTTVGEPTLISDSDPKMAFPAGRAETPDDFASDGTAASTFNVNSRGPTLR